MRAQRHDHLIAYQERLRVHHIEESDGETIEARELVRMAEYSDDKDEAQALPMASESVTALAAAAASGATSTAALYWTMWETIILYFASVDNINSVELSRSMASTRQNRHSR